MRRVLYLDLAQMFWAVDRFMNTEPSEIGDLRPESLSWEQDQFRKFLFFLGEENCLNNPAIYIRVQQVGHPGGHLSKTPWLRTGSRAAAIAASRSSTAAALG